MVKQYLAECQSYLEDGGTAYVIIPRTEQRGYASELKAVRARVVADQFIPVLGRAERFAISAGT